MVIVEIGTNKARYRLRRHEHVVSSLNLEVWNQEKGAWIFVGIHRDFSEAWDTVGRFIENGKF